MTRECSVAIVGAGPAGLYAAALLAGRCSVLVIDAKPIEIPRPCAGLLSPEAHGRLVRLGAGGSFYSNPPELALRVFLRGRELPAQRFYSIERGELEVWMTGRAKAAAVGAAFDFVPAGVAGIRREDGGWELDIGAEGTIRAAFVVGADGVDSGTRRALGIGRADTIIARQLLVEGRLETAFMVLDSAISANYYYWALPKRGGTLIGTEDSDEAVDRALRDLRARAPGFATGTVLRVERKAITRVRAMSEVALGVPGACLIGEAAGLVLPSSGEGLGGAFESAAALADLVIELGVGAVGPSGAAAELLLERYRKSLGPRLETMAADLRFADASVGARG